MKIIRLAVLRPVTTTMFFAAVVLMGIIAIVDLPRELFPTITFPELLVVTRYGAAAPEEIENIITKLVEEQVGTVPNLRKVRSISREGLSVVMLEFNWGTDMGLAHLAVREKIDQVKDRLPTEAEEPIVQRFNPFAQPMMILSMSGSMDLSDLTRIANDVVKKRLQKVDGVASATVSGGKAREILVEVDLGKMQASNVSITGIVDSLKTSNVNYPAGTTQGRFYEYLVRTIGEFKNVSEIGRTVVTVDTARESPEYLFKAMAQRKGAEAFQPKAQRLIALESIAEVKDTFKEVESYSRRNGEANISIAIQKQFNSNSVRTARLVRRALKELAISIPKEAKVDVVYDESGFIKDSLRDVTMDAVIGGLLAFLIILFFLRNMNDALIVTLALPISILVVFSCLYFQGRSINVVALAGISLGIGSITDNAIAVLDNIVSFRSRYTDPKEVAVEAASDVAIAQFTSMLTNIIVFLPLLFARGLAQQLFRDLFTAAVVSNIAALVIALTLIPRITAYPPKKKEEEGSPAEEEDILIGVGGKIRDEGAEAEPAKPVSRTAAFFLRIKAYIEGSRLPLRWILWLSEGLTDERFKKMEDLYRSGLIWALANKKKVYQYSGGLVFLSLVVFYFKAKVFMPAVDQGQFLVRINMQVGTRLDITNHVMQKVENALSKMEEVKDYMVRVGASAEESIEALGAHQGECIVTVNRRKTSAPTSEVILKLKEALANTDLEGGDIEYLLQDSSMKSVTGTLAPIAITVKGPDLAVLRRISEELELLLKKVSGVEGVKTSLALPSYETRVDIDKERASAFNLSVSDIARASLIGIRGFIATYFKEGGKEIGVRVRLKEQDRNSPDSLQRIAVRTQQGIMVPLGDVAKISSGYGPSEIQRMDQQRGVVVSAQVIGRGLGEAIEDVEKALAVYPLPKDYNLQLGGTKQEVAESFGGLVIAFVLSIILIYMVMAAGFESLYHPFLIMITVPLAVIGVAAILLVTFTPLSAPVILGIVLLGGIVVNNGIVLIDHVNGLRKEGREMVEAIITGCVDRLRPVLMTAIVTILALVPAMLGLGSGTEIVSPMALATFGGLLISTVLTLIVLPVFYHSMEERRAQKAPKLILD